MKKTILITALVLMALVVTGVGVVSAQGGNPPNGGRGMHDGQGAMHTFMVTEFARELGLNVNDINTRLTAGETMYDIALSAGVKAEDIPAIMQKVRAAALDAAVKANVITQEQANWMKSRGFGQGGMYGNGTGDCTGTGPQGNRGAGNGMMGQGHGRQNQQTNP
jgi:hypothetical protein